MVYNLSLDVFDRLREMGYFLSDKEKKNNRARAEPEPEPETEPETEPRRSPSRNLNLNPTNHKRSSKMNSKKIDPTPPPKMGATPPRKTAMGQTPPMTEEQMLRILQEPPLGRIAETKMVLALTVMRILLISEKRATGKAKLKAKEAVTSLTLAATEKRATKEMAEATWKAVTAAERQETMLKSHEETVAKAKVKLKKDRLARRIRL